MLQASLVAYILVPAYYQIGARWLGSICLGLLRACLLLRHRNDIAAIPTRSWFASTVRTWSNKTLLRANQHLHRVCKGWLVDRREEPLNRQVGRAVSET